MTKQTRTAFERVQLARHPERPYTTDVISKVFSDFVEIHGDRRYADDAALVCGFARLEQTEVAVIGQQKGRDTNQRRHRNFGMPKPEGYRKALRLMKLAEKFDRPVITLIDTPGAYPGIDAEERGQAEAIAFNLREMASLKVPTIVVIIGEGGSGGALAIGVGDRVLMMENAVYSVISPEGCAAILWKDAGQASRAAECLRLTANDLKGLGLIDEIILESVEWKVAPEKGDVSNGDAADAVMNTLKSALMRNLTELKKMTEQKRLNLRFQKFRAMGVFEKH
jgi:acetyl-CoA carboxylase carboxyl transferase subunit alpha